MPQSRAPLAIAPFVNITRLIELPCQRCYLNVFRQKLPFRDIPIQLYIRSKRRSELANDRSPTAISKRSAPRISTSLMRS
jgi:GTPase